MFFYNPNSPMKNIMFFFFYRGFVKLGGPVAQFSPGLGWSGGSAVFVTPTLHGGALLGYTGVAPKVFNI